MKDPQNDPWATVEVTRATQEGQPVLSNLYQLYIHDFTDFIEQPLGNDGRFDYDPLPPYWTEPDRFPFIVRVDRNGQASRSLKRAPTFRKGRRLGHGRLLPCARPARQRHRLQRCEEHLATIPGAVGGSCDHDQCAGPEVLGEGDSSFLGEAIGPELVTKGEETRYLSCLNPKQTQSSSL